jgi:hypothetical protein
MPLRIETFNNSRGGNAFFKAVTHPLAARAMERLLCRLGGSPLAVYDPDGLADGLSDLYPLSRLDIAGCFVQDVTAIGRQILGRRAQPITELRESPARRVLVAGFDAGRAVGHIRHLLPPGAEVATLDEIRLPDELLTNRRRYLDPVNFATNFVFFRDQAGLHTRLVTANYWAGYGASSLTLWLLLFDAEGKVLAEWREPVAGGSASIILDSRAIRARFTLPEFTGQLFLHAIGAVGQDVVKYALDTFGDSASECFSCTHDANSWPADYYAGLPAPDSDEAVTLWVQNSQPCAIPARTIGLNLMGDVALTAIDREVAPFASHAVDVASLLPAARWPQQIEVSAGKYVVRPRYEIVRGGKRRIAHVNVERTDLKPDPRLPELGNMLGKGYLLPAPILPRGTWRSLALPTPMARTQEDLPIALIVYDGAGRESARHCFGRLLRRDSVAIDLDGVIDGAALPSGYGHLELVYDFRDGGSGDGWLHGLFRYEDRASGHMAETSFGAHVFNTVLTYKDEPQSYAGRAPGLSTRLFLRLGERPHDTFCHLIYPASMPWHDESATDLVLHDAGGRELARRQVAIPCSGSLFWRYGEMFDQGLRDRAGDGAYIIIRDTSCRLFGYHGLLAKGGAFSLDHMFGF